MTGWIQTSAAFGLVGALLVILITRTHASARTAFAAWGWRIPFLFSVGPAGHLDVDPPEAARRARRSQKMQAEGGASEAPYAEAFLQWKNLKIVLLALFAIMIAQGAVWYTGFFYAQFFLETVAQGRPGRRSTG